MALPVATALINGKHVEEYDFVQLGSGLPITLSGSSTLGDGSSITTWEWSILTSDADIEGGIPAASTVDTGTNGDFTNGKASVQNPTITLDVAGGYCFALRAQNDIGQWSDPDADKEGDYQAIVYVKTSAGVKQPPPNQKRYQGDLNEGLQRLEDLAVRGAAAGESLEILDAFPGSVGPYSTGAYADIHANLESVFSVASAGLYLIHLSHQIYTTSTGCDGRLRFVFDEADYNGHTEQTIEDDTGASFFFNTGPSGSRVGVTHSFTVSLAEGTHKIKPQWKFVAGAAGLNVDAATAFHAQAVFIAGSGAGGVLTGVRGLSGITWSPTIASTWQDVDNGGGDQLIETVACSPDEWLLLMVTGQFANATLAHESYVRFVVDGTTTLAQHGFDVSTSVAPNAIAHFNHAIPFQATDSSHTVKVQGFSSSTATTFAFDSSVNVGLSIFRFRGGLVPVQLDGTTVVDKPAALNFLGADVQDNDGVADISLPAAVTSVGDSTLLTDGQPSSDIDITGSTVQAAPETGSFSFTAQLEGLYQVQVDLAIYSNSGFSASLWSLVFDEGTGSEQTIGNDDSWRVRISSGDHAQPTFSATVTLTEGAHTLKLYGIRTQGTGTVQILAPAQHTQAPTITLTAITGSGAGGVIKTQKSLSALFSHTGGNAWLAIDNGSGDDLNLTIETVADEDVLLICRGEIQHTGASAFEGGVRLNIDSGTFVGGVSEDATTAAGGNTKLAIERTYVRRFAAGTHAIQLEGFSSTAVQFSQGFAFTAVQLRGGLVPIRGDGTTVVDKPAALNFIGADVQNSGGVANISLPAAVTTDGVALDLIDQPALGTYTTTSSSFSDISSEFAATVEIPATGLYRLMMIGSVYSTGGDGGIRWEITQDGTSITDDDEKFDIYTASSAGQQEAKSIVFFRQLTAGTYEFKIRWKKVIGAGTMTVNTATHLNLSAELVTGSGAGGVLKYEQGIGGGQDIDTVFSTFGDGETLTGLSVSVDVNKGDIALVRLSVAATADQGGDAVCYANIEQDGTSVGPLLQASMVSGHQESMADSFPIEFASGGTKVFTIIASKNTSFSDWTTTGAGISVQLFRGGLVPVRADGVTKIDKPAALNFIGASVVNTGGVADISLPAAVTVPGDALKIIDLVPASAIDYSSGTFADVTNGSDDAEGTFETTVAGQYVFQLSTQLNQNGGSFTGVAFRLVIDAGGFNGFTEQTIAPDSDTAWSILVVTAGNHETGAFTTQPVTLEVGQHQVNVQYRVLSGSGGRMNTDDYLNLTAFAVAGSGAGGVLVASGVKTTNQTGIAQNTWTAISGLDLSFSIQSADEYVELSYNIIATVSVAATVALAYRVDGGTRIPLEGMTTTALWWGPKSGTKLISGLSEGDHTITFELFQDGTGTGTVFGDTSFGSIDWTSRAFLTKYRGGLVPVRQDGTTVLDKPAALDFVNAQVTNVGGIAKISMLSASGVETEKVELSSGVTISSVYTTFQDVTGLEITLTTVANEKVLLLVHGTAAYGAGNDTSYVRFDIDGTWQSNAQAASDSSLFADPIGMSEFSPALTAGSHTFKVQAAKATGQPDWTFGDATFEVVRIRGGYQINDNVPDLEYSTSSVANIVAKDGAAADLRVTLNNGQQYRATAPLTVDLSTTGLGALDTGSVAASTFYFVYAVEGATAGEFDVVASVTNPDTGPTGYDTFKYLGPLHTDGSSNIEIFRHRGGNRFYYTRLREPSAISALSKSSLHDPGAAYSVADTVPYTASEIIFHYEFRHNANTGFTILTEFFQDGDIDTSTSGTGNSSQAHIRLITGTEPWSGADVYGRLALLAGATKQIGLRIYNNGSETQGDFHFNVVGFVDGYLQAAPVQTQAKFVEDTKSPQGTWQSTTTVDFAARSGQPSTVRLTLQDGKQRTFSGTLNWDDANGVADLGYDEAGSDADDRWIYYYAVPSSGDDDVLSVRASDNAPSTGPTGYSNFRLIWAAYRTTVLLEAIQRGNVFSFDGVREIYNLSAHATEATFQTVDISTFVPASAGSLRAQGRLRGASGDDWEHDWHWNSAGSISTWIRDLDDVQKTMEFDLLIETTQTVYRRVLRNAGTGTAAVASLYARGWTDDWIDP